MRLTPGGFVRRLESRGQAVGEHRMMIYARGPKLAPQYSRTRMGSARGRGGTDAGRTIQLYLIPIRGHRPLNLEKFPIPAIQSGGRSGRCEKASWRAPSRAGKAPGAGLHAAARLIAHPSLAPGRSTRVATGAAAKKLHTRPAAPAAHAQASIPSLTDISTSVESREPGVAASRQSYQKTFTVR